MVLNLCSLQVELGKDKKSKYPTFQRVALTLALLLLVLVLCVFSLRYLWAPSPGKVCVKMMITALLSPSVVSVVMMKDRGDASQRLHQRENTYAWNLNGHAVCAVCVVFGKIKIRVGNVKPFFFFPTLIWSVASCNVMKFPSKAQTSLSSCRCSALEFTYRLFTL